MGGVYFYVLIGVGRTLGDFTAAVLSENKKYAYMAEQLQEKGLDKIAPIFAVSTLLCIYNMRIIAKMQDVTLHLGNASLKFNSTRVLLLISQIQLQVLTGLTAGSDLYEKAASLPPPYDHVVKDWHFSVYRAKLLHASLLSFECLIVVIFNRLAWRPTEAQYLADFQWDDEGVAPVAAPSGYTPLADKA